MQPRVTTLQAPTSAINFAVTPSVSGHVTVHMPVREEFESEHVEI